MILNVSGRTDVVAFYTPWFMNRYKAGFVDVRNPIYPKLVSRIYFDDVDCIVFCTKNPHPILPFLKEIKQPILFQVTLTPYKSDIEPNIFDKKEIGFLSNLFFNFLLKFRSKRWTLKRLKMVDFVEEINQILLLFNIVIFI